MIFNNEGAPDEVAGAGAGRVFWTPPNNVTAVKSPIVIPSVLPEQFIFQSEGLKPALQSGEAERLYHSIKPAVAEVDLGFSEVIKAGEVYKPEPYVPLEEQTKSPSVVNFIKELNKGREVGSQKPTLGLLDRMTNYVYRFLFNK